MLETLHRRRLLRLVYLAVFLPAMTGPTVADFHFMNITEVMAGFGGDCRIQFVEMQSTTAGQNLVSGHPLFFFDAAGNLVGSFTLDKDVPGGAGGAFILLGTQEFATATNITPDFILPDGFLMPHGGRVAFDVENPDFAVDSVAYGIYSGDNGGHGAPAPALDAAANQSLTRTATTGRNADDFSLAAPTPTNNAGETGTLTVSPPQCFLEDNFADLSNWDQPATNAGLDLNPCGLPAIADIGSVSVADGKLLLTPGLRDDLGLELPIAFTGLKNSVVQSFATEPGYRIRFDIFPQQGVLILAIFARQQYEFLDVPRHIDVSRAVGMGWNFSFDSVTEGSSDHAHPDVRLACLSEGSAEGPRDANFSPDVIPDGLLASNTKYTVIMDSEGDAVAGPLSLAVKIFPAGAAEPADFLAFWNMPDGLGAAPADDIEHGLLIAALGQNPAALEVTDFSICEIPRGDLFVRNLTCERELDGAIRIDWQNPLDAEDRPIAIVVNGNEVARVAGTETSHLLDPAPAEDATIQVINFSCTPAECTACFNDPPVPEIRAPSTGQLEQGSLTVTVDGSGSTDPESPPDELLFLWEVLSTPAGASASVDDPLAVTGRLTVNRDGEYRIRLTVTDSGCPEDIVPASDSVEHVLTVGDVAPRFRRGDASANNAFPDITDGIFVLSFLFTGGPAPPCIDAADSNDSNTLDLTDAITIFNFLFLGGEAPPDPGPNVCGPDPSEDNFAPCVYPDC